MWVTPVTFGFIGGGVSLVTFILAEDADSFWSRFTSRGLDIAILPEDVDGVMPVAVCSGNLFPALFIWLDGPPPPMTLGKMVCVGDTDG